MSTMFRSRADASTALPRKTLVWDAPTRAFHWLFAATFAGAFVTAESERWRLAHTTLGYTVLGLLAFRIAWGIFGTRHARFAAFVRGPRAVAAYLRSLVQRRPEHHAGHNPAGAIAIVALIALGGATALSGWILDTLDVHALEEVHEAIANTMLAVVGVHVAGVAVSSWLHRENLVAAMIDGRKRVPPGEGIRRAWHAVALLLVAGTAAFWLTR